VDHRLNDLETSTVQGAAGFERYHAEPDWDMCLNAENARRDSAENRALLAGVFDRPDRARRAEAGELW
jgi:hypothetical protein